MKIRSSLTVLDALDPLAAEPVATPSAFRDAMQALSRRIAFEDRWSATDFDEIRGIFNERATDWHEHTSPAYFAPLRDSLKRGEVPRQGRCLEIGSGTGLQTPTLAEHFDEVVSIDISPEMLARSSRSPAHLLLADASSLPLRDDAFEAVVCVNAFVFPGEFRRVLASGGRLVVVATRGKETPIRLEPSEVLDAMALGASTPIRATSARVGPGEWTVVQLG